MPDSRPPGAARVVVIGGGIVGCSVAYHLAKLGCADVVLLERKSLTGGTTWHAAGLVGQLRGNRSLTELAKYTAELYAGLEAETGQATGFRQVGSYALATGEGRLDELKRMVSMARTFDIDADMVEPGHVAAHFPGLDVSDVLGAIHIPGDAQTNPSASTRMSKSRIFAMPTGKSPAWPATSAKSRPRWSSTVRACGRGRWAACAASPCRCMRRNIIM